MGHLFRKNKNLGIIIAVFGLGILSAGYHCGFQKTCNSKTLDQAMRSEAVIQMPHGIIYAEVVDTPASRAQGLSGRKDLGEKEGMLFVFEHSGRYGFWMKDMLFPIDMLWINQDGYIVHIESNVSPETYTAELPATFINEPDAKYVLELSAGSAEKFGAHLGTKVRIAQ